MNIFVFSPDASLSATWLDDVRKNKMILETTQLLSTAVRTNTPHTELPVYKVTHRGHPCTKWVSKSRGNFSWLLGYLYYLGLNRSHKSLSLVSYFMEYKESGYFPLEKQTPFANCAANASQGLNFKDELDVHTAYKKYICQRWKNDTIRLTWHYGQKPDWIEEYSC